MASRQRRFPSLAPEVYPWSPHQAKRIKWLHRVDFWLPNTCIPWHLSAPTIINKQYPNLWEILEASANPCPTAQKPSCGSGPQPHWFFVLKAHPGTLHLCFCPRASAMAVPPGNVHWSESFSFYPLSPLHLGWKVTWTKLWVLRTKIQFLMLCNKYFTYWAISPAPEKWKKAKSLQSEIIEERRSGLCCYRGGQEAEVLGKRGLKEEW